jgi:hypothetical protein
MGAARDATTKTRTATREVVRMMMMMNCIDTANLSDGRSVYMALGTYENDEKE